MEVGGGRSARGTGKSDDLSLLNRLPPLHQDHGKVPVNRLIPAGVLQHHKEAVQGIVPCPRNPPRTGGPDVGVCRNGDIHPGDRRLPLDESTRHEPCLGKGPAVGRLSSSGSHSGCCSFPPGPWEAARGPEQSGRRQR